MEEAMIKNSEDQDICNYDRFRKYVCMLLEADGLYHVTKEEYEKALIFIEREIQIFPESHVAHYHLATV